jgi:thiamine-phosphate pyrophosphorylase
MPLNLPHPIIYAITSGTTTGQTTPDDRQFTDILRLFRAAVDAEVSLVQIREKSLPARVLFELTTRAVELTRGSKTRVLVNDRSDIARAAGADGVHLTTHSLPARVVRHMYGSEFLIGVSTHSRDEVGAAQAGGADLVVFGPVFETESKRGFGEPQGLDKLREVTDEFRDIPVLAIGGITLDNVSDCFQAGASGITAITLLNDVEKMSLIVETIKSRFKNDE